MEVSSIRNKLESILNGFLTSAVSGSIMTEVFSQQPLHPGLLLKESNSIAKNLRIAIESLRISFTENLINCPVTVLIQIIFFLRPLSFNNYDTAVIIILQEYIRPY